MTAVLALAISPGLVVRLLSLFFICFSIAENSEAREKRDVVIFDNGDHITCEIKYLQDGILSCATEGMGKASVEWVHLGRIESSYKFRIRAADGSRYFGSFGASAPPGKVRIVHSRGVTDLDILRIVEINPVEDSLMERIEAMVSAGYADYKASETTTVNLGLNMVYKDEFSTNTLNARSVFTKDRVETSESHRLELVRQRNLVNPRNFFSMGSILESNDELAIDYRFSLHLGLGRRVIDSSRGNLKLTAGAQVLTEEDSQGVSSDSVEGMAVMSFKTWNFDSPELDWSGQLQVFPGISEGGRIRSDANTKLRWELFSDFFWNITAFGSYDNQSGLEGSDFDYGITTGIDWEI
jgi:hypothetical protein